MFSLELAEMRTTTCCRKSLLPTLALFGSVSFFDGCLKGVVEDMGVAVEYEWGTTDASVRFEKFPQLFDCPRLIPHIGGS